MPIAIGTASAYTGRNCGTAIAVIARAPIITIVADSSGWVTCCSISSTFSTSRTTLVCTIEELTREWYPIDRLCRRCARALRRSAPVSRTTVMNCRV